MKSIEELLEVMARLRSRDNGCPWDVEQNFSTIAPYTIEEAYEVADAIDRADMDGLRDELGDLLFQVVFHARMAEEEGSFDFEDVVRGIVEKMTRRHPHVFGSAQERAAGPAKGAWEQIKAAERAAREKTVSDSALDDVAHALPALKRAYKLGKRASSAGFDWPDTQGVRAKIQEEMAEVSAAECGGMQQDIEDELGDLLFAVVNLARHLRVDPEAALTGANRKFEKRFRSMEKGVQDSGKRIGDLSLEALDTRWREAKKAP